MKASQAPSTNTATTAQRRTDIGMILTRGAQEFMATITGEYYRGSRDIDDPEEIIDLEARDEAGNRIELTEREEERAIAKLLEAAR